MEVPQKAKNRTTYDPATLNSTPGYVSQKKNEKTLIWKDMCTSMSIAALFIIAKIWKHPMCSSTDEWIKTMWYIHTHHGILLHKKERNVAICNDMNEPGRYYA